MATNTLSLEQDIQPLSEFRRNSAQIISKLKKENRTIVLTQHGKSAAVLVDVAAYQRMLDKMELMEELLEAERQINTGDVVSHDEAKRQILHNLEKWK
ncbi:MAG: type II toxin-antitoxin system Phd/YefM family antitoxin [Bacteroidetes bacterium]|nr:type II toxin-antitoxin system Phd/YefM family antitoxin [Bacteroidota bacterium]MCH8525153.1 type II toxin-antitoxin system Phd/YefM family antitoxin [Balneolales bacterium]